MLDTDAVRGKADHCYKNSPQCLLGASDERELRERSLADCILLVNIEYFLIGFCVILIFALGKDKEENKNDATGQRTLPLRKCSPHFIHEDSIFWGDENLSGGMELTVTFGLDGSKALSS